MRHPYSLTLSLVQPLRWIVSELGELQLVDERSHSVHIDRCTCRTLNLEVSVWLSNQDESVIGLEHECL